MRTAVKAFILFITACALFVGCSSKLEPLSIEQAPAELRKAFATAQSFLNKTAEGVAQQISAKEYAPATIQLQALLSNTTLTKEQRNVASRVLVAVSQQAPDPAVAAPTEAAPAAAETPKAPMTEKEAEAAAIREHYIRTK